MQEQQREGSAGISFSDNNPGLAIALDNTRSIALAGQTIQINRRRAAREQELDQTRRDNAKAGVDDENYIESGFFAEELNAELKAGKDELQAMYSDPNITTTEVEARAAEFSADWGERVGNHSVNRERYNKIKAVPASDDEIDPGAWATYNNAQLYNEDGSHKDIMDISLPEDPNEVAFADGASATYNRDRVVTNHLAEYSKKIMNDITDRGDESYDSTKANLLTTIEPFTLGVNGLTLNTEDLTPEQQAALNDALIFKNPSAKNIVAEEGENLTEKLIIDDVYRRADENPKLKRIMDDAVLEVLKNNPLGIGPATREMIKKKALTDLLKGHEAGTVKTIDTYKEKDPEKNPDKSLTWMNKDGSLGGYYTTGGKVYSQTVYSSDDSPNHTITTETGGSSTGLTLSFDQEGKTTGVPFTFRKTDKDGNVVAIDSNLKNLHKSKDGSYYIKTYHATATSKETADSEGWRSDPLLNANATAPGPVTEEAAEEAAESNKRRPGEVSGWVKLNSTDIADVGALFNGAKLEDVFKASPGYKKVFGEETLLQKNMRILGEAMDAAEQEGNN